MKTDRRHDLQTNELADYLGKILARIKPYTNHIVAGVLAVLLIAVVWSLASGYLSGNEETAWKDLRERKAPGYVQSRIKNETESLSKEIETLGARIRKLIVSENDEKREELDAKMEALETDLSEAKENIRAAVHRDIERIAEEFADDPVGWYAALHLADTALQDGVNHLYPQQQSAFSRPDIPAARKQLDEAVKYYKLVKQRTNDPLLKQRAQYDLARAFETSADVDKQDKKSHLKSAKKEYAEVANSASVYGRLAQRRLDMLSDPDDRFHTWFQAHLNSLASPEKKKAKTSFFD